jgi:hypothetical protein
MKNLFLLTILCFLVACSNKKAMQNSSNQHSKGATSISTVDNLEVAQNAYLLTKISDDPEYGYTSKKPIKVASMKSDENIAQNEYLYMNALLGPDGEEIEYKRTGSCCGYKSNSPKAFLGSALLDKYEVTIKGKTEKKVLYLDMYESGIVVAPLGFTFKK